MKYRLNTSSIDVKTFLSSVLDDEENNENNNDWREKARQLRLRRWRKINDREGADTSMFENKYSKLPNIYQVN